MITELITDTIGHYENGHPTKLLPAGTPVQFLAFWPSQDHIAPDKSNEEQVLVRLPSNKEALVPAVAVSSGLSTPPEITLSQAHDQFPCIGRSTLNQLAREGRILARRAGPRWMTTETAIQYFLELSKSS